MYNKKWANQCCTFLRYSWVINNKLLPKTFLHTLCSCDHPYLGPFTPQKTLPLKLRRTPVLWPEWGRCRHVFVDGKGCERRRRRNTSYDSRRAKGGPRALHIEERIPLLTNILFFTVENSDYRNRMGEEGGGGGGQPNQEQLEVFLWSKNCKSSF